MPFDRTTQLENTRVFRQETSSQFTGTSRGPSYSPQLNKSKHEESSRWRSQACYCCGHTGHRAKDVQCPANGKTWQNCAKVGHFATVCRSRPKPANNANYTLPPQNQAFQVSEKAYVFYSDDDEWIFHVQQFPTLPTNNIAVEGVSVPSCQIYGCTPPRD